MVRKDPLPNAAVSWLLYVALQKQRYGVPYDAQKNALVREW